MDLALHTTLILLIITTDTLEDDCEAIAAILAHLRQLWRTCGNCGALAAIVTYP